MEPDCKDENRSTPDIEIGGKTPAPVEQNACFQPSSVRKAYGWVSLSTIISASRGKNLEEKGFLESAMATIMITGQLV